MKKKIVIILIAFLILGGFVSFLGISFAEKIPTSIPSIEIKSSNADYDNKEAGAWKVTKSAKWISRGKARITFDIDTIIKSNTDYKDFILVLDTSVSMEGNKIRLLKENTIDLVEDILQDQDSRVGLITFSTESTILSELSNNTADLTNKVQEITALGDTNYYKALVNVDEILAESASDRPAVVLFLTDGLPNLNTPNEVAQYNYLKSQYEYVTFTGIQYEMGKIVSQALKRITDNQYVSDMSTLHNVLFDATKNHLNYDSFKITDYINSEYFTVTNDITKTIGEVSINDNQVVWNIANLVSGKREKETMTIDIELKNEYLDSDILLPTNSNTKVESNIEDNSEDVTTAESPRLKNKYYVRYDVNTPSGCTINNIGTESNAVFSVFTINNQELSCPGYEFKGWELTTEEAVKINDNHFIMPETDVEFKGTWSKLDIKKSADGTVSKVQTFYNMMKEQSVPDNIKSTYVESDTGIDFSKSSSDINGKGVYEVASTHDDEYPVYYYRGAVQNNNVLFADMCFKIVISTETGGVKLIYNGLPSSTGSCNNTGDNAQIGKKLNYNTNVDSLSDVGYMYGSRYSMSNKKSIDTNWLTYAQKTTTYVRMILVKSGMGATNYYYGDTITWDDENNKYILSNSDNSDVQLLTWESNYRDLVGKYTCFSDSEISCSKVNYIVSSSSSSAYYIELNDGNYLNSYHRYASNDISYDEYTNTYTLNNPVDVGLTWQTNYNNYKGYYFCDDLESVSCTSVYYASSPYSTSITAIYMSNGETYDSLYSQALSAKILFGNGVDSNGILINTTTISPVNWRTEYKNIVNYHYTCFTDSDRCSSEEVYYVYKASDTSVNYVILPKGKTIENALSEMFDINPNQYSSAVKGDKDTPDTVDYWYYNNIELKDYSKYIEDTVYCNDRSIYLLGGLDPNGDNIDNSTLYFGPSYRGTSEFYRESKGNPDTKCPRDIDKFTVSNSIGNGKLDYPVGLITSDEARFAGENSGASSPYNYLKTDAYYWTMSPVRFLNNGPAKAYVGIMCAAGYIGGIEVYSYWNVGGIRPVISLKPDTRIDQGDGTVNDPYQIEMEED